MCHRWHHDGRIMRGLKYRLVATLLGGACAAASGSARGEGDFQLSFAAGSTDGAGRFMRGSELRVLAVHGGKLYAGNGYWEDRPGPQGAQILVLDGSGARWRVEHAFDEPMPGGRPRDLAVAALNEVGFATAGTGVRLPQPVSLLMASTWDLTGTTRVFSRDDATGAWTATTLAQDRTAPDFLPQVRSFGGHRDRQTGIHLVFAGQHPRRIFSGNYDATATGRVRWGAAPELDISRISMSGFPGLAGRLRVSSFADCNGRLYAAIGHQIYERSDGPEPRWRLVYTNPHPGRSETGLPGLTAVPNPSGTGQVLLAAVQGDADRIVRVDPKDGSEATELDLGSFLSTAWQSRVGYVIAAYNDMAKIRDTQRGDLLLMGLEAFIPARSPVSSGPSVVA